MWWMSQQYAREQVFCDWTPLNNMTMWWTWSSFLRGIYVDDHHALRLAHSAGWFASPWSDSFGPIFSLS
jgi:hypothetical protein